MMVAPRRAAENLARLEREGYLSPHGFYDAIDFTPPAGCTDVPPGRRARARRMPHGHGASQRHDACGLGQRAFGLADAAAAPQESRLAAHDLLLQDRVPQAIHPMNSKMRKHVKTNSK